jgi:hypothetical protein
MTQIAFYDLYFTVFYRAHLLVDTVNVSSEMSAELKSSGSFTVGVPKFQIH